MLAASMRSWTPLAVCAAAVAVVVAVHVCLPGRPPVQGGVDLCGPSDAIRARLEAKDWLAHEVVAGRLSLVEAASALKALDEGGAPRDDATGGSGAGYCRTIIAWVKAVAPADQADDMARGLEAELDARLRNGTLRLAEPCPAGPTDGLPSPQAP